MYHILKNIIYKDGKLYSSEIEKVLEINVVHSGVIKIHPLLEEIKTEETRPGDLVGAGPNWVTFWSKLGLF